MQRFGLDISKLSVCLAIAFALAACGGGGGGGGGDGGGGGGGVAPVVPGGNPGGGGGGGAPTLTLDSVSPASSFTPGGTQVSVSGSGFSGGMSVTFGGTPGTGVNVLGPDRLEVTAPPGAFGEADVAVSDATETKSLPDAFAYVRFPPVFAARDVKVDISAGASASVQRPKISSSGANVYVVWSEARAGAGQDIYFRYSKDRGNTWSTSDLRLNTNAAGSSASLTPQICSDGDNVFVSWKDNRNTRYEPYFNRSTDGGTTWLASDVRVSSAAGNLLSVEPAISCDGRNVVITWVDDRNNAPFRGADVWANRSTDGGLTWLPSDARVSTTAAGTLPTIVSATKSVSVGSTVHLTWIDWRTGGTALYFSRSTNAGATWQAAETRVDTNSTSLNVSDPAICAAGQNVHIVWRDLRSGGVRGLFARSSTNGGASFRAGDVEVNHTPAGPTGTLVGVPAIACEGDNLYVTWTDPRNGIGSDVWFNRSTDRGASFAATDTRLNPGVGAASTTTRDPSIGTNGDGAIHVAWADNRNGSGFDVFVNSSDDEGAAWLTTAQRLDTDLPGAANSHSQSLCTSGAFLYVVWQDDRNATAPEAGYDIVFNGNNP